MQARKSRSQLQDGVLEERTARAMSEGVPRLQLDTLGGRGTPRGSASRQQALQRVFKGLDDDDDDYDEDGEFDDGEGEEYGD